jgi:hypothetical protein
MGDLLPNRNPAVLKSPEVSRRDLPGWSPGDLRRAEAAGGVPPNLNLVHASETITMQDKGLKLALMAKRPNAAIRWQSGWIY